MFKSDMGPPKKYNEETTYFNLRLPASLLDRIETLISAQPFPPSKQDFILRLLSQAVDQEEGKDGE